MVVVELSLAEPRGFRPLRQPDRRPHPALANSRRLPSRARLTIDGEKSYKISDQSVTVLMDAGNVLDATNIQSRSQVGQSPFVNTAGDDHAIYYTETGWTGGACLQEMGDGLLDRVPLHDPRVLEEDRNVCIGVNIAS